MGKHGDANKEIRSMFIKKSMALLYVIISVLIDTIFTRTYVAFDNTYSLYIYDWTQRSKRTMNNEYPMHFIKVFW